MILKKALLLTVLPWVAGISLLHGWMNLGLFSGDKGSGKALKVGFLPVT